MIVARRSRGRGRDHADVIGRTNLCARLRAFRLAPLFQQRVAAARVALFGDVQRDDAVDAKVANVAAQLAPRGDDANAIEIGQRKRPDRPIGVAALVVAIVDRDLPLGANRPPDRRQFVFAHRNHLAGRNDQCRIVRVVAQIRRQHGKNFCERVARGCAQLRIGAFCDPARAEHQRLDLLFRKHQRRQHEAGLQHVAEAGFAVDRRALALQGGDVAIERANADAELVGERLPGHRLAVAAKDLQQFEQAFGARHGSP